MSEEWARKKEAERIANGSPLEACAVLESQAKTIHFVRHAQATHNEAAEQEGRKAYANPLFHDARLTDFGKEQCEELRSKVGFISRDVQLVVVSPCSRATQTALIGFKDVPASVKRYALECIREKSGDHPCDGRRTVSELKPEYPTIDYSLMDDDEDVYGGTLGENRETDDMIIARAHKFLEWINNRPEKNIVVVTHSAFLVVLFNKVVICNSDMSKWFENCEMRTTNFAITGNEGVYPN